MCDYYVIVLGAFLKGAEMIGILILFSLGVTYGLVEAFDDDDDNDESSENVVAETQAEDMTTLMQGQDTPDVVLENEAGETDDLIIEAGVEDGFLGLLSGAVADSVITQEEADTVAQSALVVEGPLDIDAGDGDDLVLGGADADVIQLGLGDDIVTGGPGDDDVRLGAGYDVYGVDQFNAEDLAEAITIYGSETNSEGGDDSVLGARGNDIIFDGFGTDVLDGGNGNDVINAVDQAGLEPDTVLGGIGNDMLFVDQGDDVTSGDGRDSMFIDIEIADVAAGYVPTIIQDFNPKLDSITLDIDGDDAAPAEIAVTPLADGAGSSVLVNGTVVARLLGEGAVGLTPEGLSIL